MVVATAVGPHEQDLVAADDTAHEALDNPDALDALPRVANEARVAAGERDELEQLRATDAVQRRDRVWLLGERLQRGTRGRPEIGRRAWRVERRGVRR